MCDCQVNHMIRIFLKSKWTSWHCHVKKTLVHVLLKFWKTKHRVWITIIWIGSFCKQIVPTLTEHVDVIETQTKNCMRSQIAHAAGRLPCADQQSGNSTTSGFDASTEALFFRLLTDNLSCNRPKKWTAFYSRPQYSLLLFHEVRSSTKSCLQNNLLKMLQLHLSPKTTSLFRGPRGVFRGSHLHNQ